MQKVKEVFKSRKTGLSVAIVVAASIQFVMLGAAVPPQSSNTGTASVPAPPAPVIPDAAGQRKFLEASRSEHNQVVAWQRVTTMNFDNATDLQRLPVKQGRWEIANGQLQAVGGVADDNRTILLAPCLAGPMRLEFDATLFARPDGRIGDIAVRLNADPVNGSFERGYALITAQYWNQATVCYKLNIPIARTEWSPIVPGRRHHVVVEWTNQHLRFFIDERIVLEAWDRESTLPPDPNKWIGLSTYDTHMVIDNFSISAPRGS